ncbi:hypothetical protein SAMN02910298_01741 [Pseudobutyrivibrio sp. YE44]|uniref:hypothetical protein n=1 Tax=Pseudobutyrivibrio sp. YE44 TaxID=1520802 RepID=UPI000888DBFB|nr:hypothetical protein [Pseudobutyrivibrio sp. YE44]SDB35352.1 hypothetical protein SAMN02910298_01741 [Pseudobutyrivibrio sp. YE44]
MKKKFIIALMLTMSLFLVGCGASKEESSDTTETVETKETSEPAESAETVEVSETSEATETVEVTENTDDTASDSSEVITGEQALAAVHNYCLSVFPELKEYEESGDYGMYWDIASEDENEIVIIYRSYTGAIDRYYIDPKTGETYVTEFVSGITDGEEKTGETLNIKDYIE